MVSKQTGQKSTPKTQFSFGIKYKIIKDKGGVNNKIYLSHTQDGHNKFYNLELKYVPTNIDFPYVVFITYGRIGTMGNVTTSKFVYEADAGKFLAKKIAEKLAKGYKHNPF